VFEHKNNNPSITHILKSSADLLQCKNISQLLDCLHGTISDLSLDGFYRLDLNQKIHIKYFQDGKLLQSNNVVVQRGCHQDHVTVVDLEHSLTFKLPLIQFHLQKTPFNLPLIEEHQYLLLIWLQQVSSVLVHLENQLSMQHIFSNKQDKLKLSIEILNEELPEKLASLSEQQIALAQGYTQLITSKVSHQQQQEPNLVAALQDHGLAIHELIIKQDSLNLCIVSLLKSVNEHLE